MRSSKTQIWLIAFALALSLSGAALAQEDNKKSDPQSEKTKQTANDGQLRKIDGIVVSTNRNTFTVRDIDGTDTEVVVVEKTSIRISRKGLFRRDRTTDGRDIIQGLRLKVNGRANSDGQLVAKAIDIAEQDLRTAQMMKSRIDPVEAVATSAQDLAETNSNRIDENDKRLDQAEQNARRLSGQVEELSVVATAAGDAARKAQSTADQAESNANTANQRISSLDEYEVFKTIAVNFKPGSARLSAQAKAQIDEAASSVSENLKGWIVAVAGYADSSGRSGRNRQLSQRRAEAVINYLVTKHGLPLRRVVQPFGYGSLNPVASNQTRGGRSQNRRAEIAVLVNKGVSSEAGSTQTASGEQLSRQH
jgi:outer membrane protein OmpA-like peptidoglycan-associated protein